MANFSVEKVSESGLKPTFSSCNSGGDTFDNDSSERTYIRVNNGDASQHTVTVNLEDSDASVPGFGTVTKSAVSVDIPAGEERSIGPFPQRAFGYNPDIQYDAVTSMTIAVVKVGSA